MTDMNSTQKNNINNRKNYERKKLHCHVFLEATARQTSRFTFSRH